MVLELLGFQIFRVCNRVRNEPFRAIFQPGGHCLDLPPNPVGGELNGHWKLALAHHALNGPPRHAKGGLDIGVSDKLRQMLRLDGDDIAHAPQGR